ncbi:MAG: hypothetical protein HZB99_04630 [Candidatus Harrisonbacteria bacterium]|nr:hypothetical protein [Candidatus Harrisonbacteria bacterium]
MDLVKIPKTPEEKKFEDVKYRKLFTTNKGLLLRGIWQVAKQILEFQNSKHCTPELRMKLEKDLEKLARKLDKTMSLS